MKKYLINKAKKRYPNGIKPMTGRANLMDCFTIEDDMLIFWFNDSKGSTHILIERI